MSNDKFSYDVDPSMLPNMSIDDLTSLATRYAQDIDDTINISFNPDNAYLMSDISYMHSVCFALIKAYMTQNEIIRRLTKATSNNTKEQSSDDRGCDGQCSHKINGHKHDDLSDGS